MSGLLGHTHVLSRTPTDVVGTRKNTADYLNKVGPGGTNSASYLNDPSFVNQIIQPFRNLFNLNQNRSLAQAKESAGNLTGSGFASTLGTEVNRGVAQEQAFEGGMLNENANANAGRFLQLLLGMNTAGVGAPETGYQPGFLDALFKAAGTVGGAVAGKTPGAAIAGGQAGGEVAQGFSGLFSGNSSGSGGYG